MSAKLTGNTYGKSDIRLTKVIRKGALHELLEFSIDILLSGDFADSYLQGDNSKIVATDSMKNTVYAVARGSSATTPEDFALELGNFLASRNPQISSVRIAIEETRRLPAYRAPTPTDRARVGRVMCTPESRPP